MPFIPLPDAAARLKLSESTIRRKIKRGNLRAQQEETIQGYRWLVEVPDQVDGQVGTSGDQVSTTNDQVGITLQPHNDVEEIPQENDEQAATSGEQVSTIDAQVVISGEQVGTTGLIQELRRLHDQNVQLAGQIGYLQSELRQAREQIRLLTDSQHVAEQAAPAPIEPAPEAEPIPQAAEPKRVPWWRRLFAET